MDDLENQTNSDDSENYLECRAPSPNSSPRRKSSESDVGDYWKNDSINDLSSSDLKRDSENKKYEEKIKTIQSVLSPEPKFELLKELAKSEGGLVSDKIRKTAWPLLLELTVNKEPDCMDEEELKNHPSYQQVLLDVNRSLSRFPPWIPQEKRVTFLNELTVLIMRVVKAHPGLQYYQGYHDVAITLLLVTGLDEAFVILEKLSNHHLKEFMEPTMERTSHLLNYIYPLVKQLNSKLHEHLDKSGVGNMFALPWLITWFSHSLRNYHQVVRLYDYFLASEPLAPLYLSAVIVNFRAKEILEQPCDMPSIHSLLCEFPDDLPFDDLLDETTKLYKKCPPELVEREALLRTEREEEQRKRYLEERKVIPYQPFFWRLVNKLDPQKKLPIWIFIPHGNRRRRDYLRYRYLMATVTLAVGLYAVFVKSVA